MLRFTLKTASVDSFKKGQKKMNIEDHINETALYHVPLAKITYLEAVSALAMHAILSRPDSEGHDPSRRVENRHRVGFEHGDLVALDAVGYALSLIGQVAETNADGIEDIPVTGDGGK